MKIYFAGAALCEVFDEKQHRREDLKIFSFSISQKEDEVACADVKMENDAEKLALLKKHEKFFISWENQGKVELIFTGILSGGNQTCEGHFCVFQLYAAPPQLEEDVKSFLQQQKKAPYWDPLFVPPEKREKSLEIQDARLESLYVDRKSWELKRSSFFKGSQQIDLKGNFLRESFVSHVVQPPLRAVRLTLKAEWIQDQEGYVDIARAIARKFPGFQINSFSSIGIEANWPKQGQKVGRSGYEVIKSRFDRIKHQARQPIPFSPPFKVTSGVEKYYVRRHWYDAKLYLRWQYRQKRRETLSFTLQHEFQKEVPLSGEVKEISITLQNINSEPRSCRWIPKAYYREGMLVTLGTYTYVAKDDHKSSYTFEKDRAHWKLKSESDLGREARVEETFFLSPRGRQAFEHALTLAQYHLAKSARGRQIKVIGSWENLISVTTDHTVRLEDPRIPGGQVHGKVVHYRIYAEGEGGRRAVEITIASTLGIDTKKEVQLQEKYAPHFALDGYCEDDYGVKSGLLKVSPSGISYYDFGSQCPREGLLNWRRLHSVRMVKSVIVKNGPLDQLKALGNAQGQFKEVLKEKQTQVQVQLYDLRTKSCLEHNIEVALAGGWSVPVWS